MASCIMMLRHDVIGTHDVTGVMATVAGMYTRFDDVTIILMSYFEIKGYVAPLVENCPFQYPIPSDFLTYLHSYS